MEKIDRERCPRSNQLGHVKKKVAPKLAIVDNVKDRVQLKKGKMRGKKTEPTIACIARIPLKTNNAC
jgi:hypothetical protein